MCQVYKLYVCGGVGFSVCLRLNSFDCNGVFWWKCLDVTLKGRKIV